MFKKKGKLFSLFALVMVVMLAFAGCAPKAADSNTSSDTSTDVSKEKEYKIVLVLPGPINDQGWNATAYAGLQMVEKNLGIKMEYIES